MLNRYIFFGLVLCLALRIQPLFAYPPVASPVLPISPNVWLCTAGSGSCSALTPSSTASFPQVISGEDTLSLMMMSWVCVPNAGGVCGLAGGFEGCSSTVPDSPSDWGYGRCCLLPTPDSPAMYYSSYYCRTGEDGTECVQVPERDCADSTLLIAP